MRCRVSGEVTVLGQGEYEVKVLRCGKGAQVREGTSHGKDYWPVVSLDLILHVSKIVF